MRELFPLMSSRNVCVKGQDVPDINELGNIKKNNQNTCSVLFIVDKIVITDTSDYI